MISLLCVEYKESNNNEITISAEKVVRPWPDRPDRRLRPCCSRSSVMVERIDVSVCCILEKMCSDSDVVAGSVPMMVSSRLGNLALLQLLSAAVQQSRLHVCGQLCELASDGRNPTPFPDSSSRPRRHIGLIITTTRKLGPQHYIDHLEITLLVLLWIFIRTKCANSCQFMYEFVAEIQFIIGRRPMS